MIDELLVKLISRQGIAIWYTKGGVLSACLDKDGRIGEPRNWMPHKTVEQALVDLGRRMAENWPPPTREQSAAMNSASHPFCLGREVLIVSGPDEGKFGVISGHGDISGKEIKVDVIESNRLHHFRWIDTKHVQPTM